jgi:hypothetical protein
VILSSDNGSSRAAWTLVNRMRWNKDLVGIKNGINPSFLIPDGDKFLQSGENVVRVYRNGLRQNFGAGSDYTVSESGGVGTGYDTITFNGTAPLAYEELTADYMIDV